MKMLHRLKLSVHFADAVLSGEKSFEIRKNDRGFQKGDMVEFTAVDDLSLTVEHDLNGRTYEITYVLSGWGIEPGYVGFAIREVGV